jgi:hypothetical protein
VVLTTAPVIWSAENMTGYNGDTPQSATIYLTCDNLSSSSMAVAVTIVFVPLQS